jgi:hypothetical protein
MTNCTKYKVIDMDKIPTTDLPKSLEVWINEQYEAGLELVTVRSNQFIFKRNAYLVSMKKVESKE